MTATAPPPRFRPRRVRPRRAQAHRLLVPAPAARLVAFAALALLGALRWNALVAPARPGIAVLSVVGALLLGGALAATSLLPRLVLRALAVAVLVAALIAGALLSAGVPARWLLPAHWDELVSGLWQGAEVLPQISIPYRGDEPAAELALLASGGLLLALATALAFWPRGGGRSGFPVLAGGVVTVMVGISAVQNPPVRPLLLGALLALMLVLLIWLQHVERVAAPVAALMVIVAVGAGLTLGPTVDRERPLLDYVSLARDISPSAGTAFSWDHSYGPITWPRTGAEVIRVRSPRREYWKAVSLAQFDGEAWRAELPDSDAALDTEIAHGRRSWFARLRVTVRDLRSREFVTAGTTLSIAHSPRVPVVSGPGRFRTERRPLVSGHTYEADVYTPRPSAREMATAGTAYPSFATSQLTMELPERVGGPPLPAFPPVSTVVRFPAFGSTEQLTVATGGLLHHGATAAAMLRDSRYDRMYALAQRLRAGAATPYDYITAVQRHLRRGFTYTERPPRADVPLDAFLFRTRRGYCQQFSGAMALLLRMGGVPARVAEGFAPGTFDAEQRRYVVHDFDAHSWVEAYIPRAGWATFDPTPAAAPAQSRDIEGGGAAVARRGAELRPEPTGNAGAAITSDPQDTGGLRLTPVLVLVVVGAALLLACAVGVAALVGRRRRRRDPAATTLTELQRALRRSGHPAAPSLTIEQLARRYTGTAAEPYLRRMQGARFAGRHRWPGAAERAGLRRVLSTGRGPWARLRLWWALPPW